MVEPTVAMTEWVRYGPHAREHQPEFRQRGAKDEPRRPGLRGGLRLERGEHHPEHGQEERDPHDPGHDPPADLADISEPRGRGPAPRRQGGHAVSPLAADQARSASSNWKTRANRRSANVATMMVRMTVITPGRGRPADVEGVIDLLVEVEGQVGGGCARPAVGHQPDRVEEIHQVDRAQQDAELNVGPQVRQRELTEGRHRPGTVDLGRLQRVGRLALEARPAR